MENWIRRIFEPRRLFLAWQAADLQGERFRWAVGILTPDGDGCSLRYFRPGAEFERYNPRHNFEELLRLGYRGYPAFSVRHEVHRDAVLQTLMRRLPPRNRTDFGNYARSFRLPSDLALTDFALLGYTEAKLPSDGFSVVDPLSAEAQSCDLMLEIAGYRHYANDHPAKLGQEIELVAEPGNAFDPNAVQVRSFGNVVGYVNRLQAETFLQWLRERRVSGCVERVNGPVDRPRAFMFVRIRPTQERAAA